MEKTEVILEVYKHCSLADCEALRYQEPLADHAKKISDENNSEVRKKLYRFYVTQKWGYLGKGVRVRIPDCVREEVRKIAPDSEGKYMGHKDE